MLISALPGLISDGICLYFLGHRTAIYYILPKKGKAWYYFMGFWPKLVALLHSLLGATQINNGC